MRSLVLIITVLALGAACGIKGPPKPPLEAVAAPEPVTSPCDAGCGEKR